MNPSTAQARVLVDELVRNTVSHVVLSPGSRNAPLSFALHDAAMAGRLTLHVRIDERSAAFLALGIAARTGRPVALVCTSGTAAANFHPAVLEADRAGVPLIVLTADRPPELRAAGANQVIDQRGLYGPAVRYFDELAVAERRPGQNAYWRSQICRAWNAAYGEWRCGPVHLNIPFREPLVPDGKDDPDDWPEPLDGRPQGARWTELPDFGALPSSVVPSARHGLVVACDAGVRAAGEWAELHGWPVVSETGGLGLGGTTAIAGGVWLLGVEEFLAEHKPEQVLCIGRPTVFRQVQRLLSDPDIEVLLVRPDSDWPAPAHNVRQVGQWFDEPAKPADPEWLSRWREADAAAVAAVRETLAEQPWPTGLSVASELVENLPPDSLLVVGSSNPTRDVALVGGRRPDVLVHRNRGVAGIDGTISTAVGAALVHSGPAYALVGDLTFLHDVNGLLAGPTESRPDLTIVVLNDDGGGIFSLLEQGEEQHSARFERVFGTPHGADLSALCAGYGVPYTLASSREVLREALRPAPGLRVVEVRVDRSRHRELHALLRGAVAKAIDTR
ncbi:2-succinyl-5-enolpyruvyl-6-hydroxy-3-cyclohexene-1-carboxylic-acid synthase [Saccharomonospora viridis]|uniref:2-succinyl-5-enolpyruvyl-6-hydroxy-3-cyclohexene-1-carboxylate synthase n=2 Tax=Saccharomonospora viridis TaxID=1852 RepID=C7MTC2_SACVD|nr:2-succinyl-5-enolpyruvyl-6-hydroxy-3-cyclohexene-1-carboxylic-acid synthase [Saccharomonospora viridis]ACU95392.1 2-succinyl-6-hydroxy-2,4-cyclohexadiene-1-carboxylate synthase [Saccharomonospora viridis DSM 43017]KHF45024.1 2-succinyl-5-enolpyruvyl-6-hydroxy-3-cyclohexene-1-carboxylate synthase [Saccharomonospora viridis]SFP15221.1 2-succinyl-5-enolpyruvyl-6-hydroxy-3-cyclohexene-1-carboxylate synthase [Saccharomonospora viridis]